MSPTNDIFLYFAFYFCSLIDKLYTNLNTCLICSIFHVHKIISFMMTILLMTIKCINMGQFLGVKIKVDSSDNLNKHFVFFFINLPVVE